MCSLLPSTPSCSDRFHVAKIQILVLYILYLYHSGKTDHQTGIKNLITVLIFHGSFCELFQEVKEYESKSHRLVFRFMLNKKIVELCNLGYIP